jgi:RND family efflux transporter MFP subunit
VKQKQSTILGPASFLLLFAAGSLITVEPSQASIDEPPSAVVAPVPNRPLPAITVEAAYPSTDANVVAETVAFPIEQEVNGLEGIRHLMSRSTAGAYTLHITFGPGTDLTLAQVLVQERVNLALPVLPDAVKALGVTVRKRSPGPLLFVTLVSPDSRFDSVYLTNYASIQIKDELARLRGVGAVSLFGEGDFGVRIWLDPDRLAARALTAADIVRSFQDLPGQVGLALSAPRPSFLTIPTLGRLAEIDTIANLAVKTRADGGTVRLRDVARVELGAGASPGIVRLDGKPAVALAIFPAPQAHPSDVSSAVQDRMARLKEVFPSGIDYSIAFDLAPNADGKRASTTFQDLLAEPILPPAIAGARAEQLIARCSQTLMQSEGVRHILVLPENPFGRFRGGPCLLAMLGLKGQERDDQERLTSAVRARLRQVEGMQTRIFDVSWPSGYPLDLAIYGPEADDVKELTEKLIDRLGATKRLTDLPPVPAATKIRQISIDVSKAEAHGVKPADIAVALQAYLGSVDIADLNRMGRAGHIKVQVETPAREPLDGVKRLRVRNTQGQMVSLANLVTLREVKGMANVDRLDFRPMAAITANPAPGVSLAEARWLCETLADKVRKDLRLGSEYRLVWMRELPAAKAIAGVSKTVARETPPPEVAVAQPVARKVTDYETFTGRTDAVSTVEVRARVTGYLDKAVFREGAQVKQGDLLFEIDPRPYQADLNLGEANLKQAEAERALQEQTAARLKKLMAAGSIAKEEYDQGIAAVDKARATVAALQAAADKARLFLTWTKVVAPITGRISRRQLDPGNLVTADTTILATIVSQDPMYVYFDIDETTALRLWRFAREAKAKPPAEGETPAYMGLADEEGFPHRGIVNFMDNRVNADTGTIRARVIFANADGMLSPGLFARIRLALGAPRQALLVPEKAIRSDQGLKFVYVVDNEDKVEYRRVHLGAMHDGLRIIEEGLKPDERVVHSAATRVKPGMTVRPRMVPPPATNSPKPR